MKPLIVGNWKANKTIAQAAEWVAQAKGVLETIDKVQTVVCGSYPVLPTLTTLLANSKVKVGAQNVSSFEKGAYTGEVSAEMLKGLAEYCIVGHSERKRYFGETEGDISQKIKNLLKNQITPVLCLADPQQLQKYLAEEEIQKQTEKIVFVYEPPSAISGGGDYHPESPENANINCQKVQELVGTSAMVLYGGSVNRDNIKAFLSQPFIHGALPGQASLDPEDFTSLIRLAAEAVV